MENCNHQTYSFAKTPHETTAPPLKALDYAAVKPLKRSDLLVLRFFVLAGILLLLQFLGWYFDPDHVGNKTLFWLLTISLGYKLLHLVSEWYYVVAMKVPEKRAIQRDWKVDMLTTYVPGEPYDMVVATLEAMVEVQYPHTTYLCDEGNDPYLREVCWELGVVHVYRGPEKQGAKAGNINYALEHFATGDICVILDPDHVPSPNFLERVLPYFEDDQLGFVQSIQGYSNADDSFVARGAAEQTYLFYGPLMMGMNRRGTVQAIGANCAFRRAALDSIGGHAAGLCEDMHTSMRLHAKQWTSIYLPEMLTRGRVPDSISAYYKQQLKWARGSFELLFEVYPKLFKNFTWQQRLHYLLTPLYFLYGFIGLIDISIPVYSLLAYQVPLYIEFTTFVLYILPVLLIIVLIRQYAQHYLPDRRETGFHLVGGVLRVGTWWIYLLGLVYSILRIKVPYIPTPKESEARNEWAVSLPNIAMVLVILFAVGYGLKKDLTPFSWIMAGFAGVNAALLGLVVLAGQHQWIASFSQRLESIKLGNLSRWFRQAREHYIYPAIRNVYFSFGLALLSIGIALGNILDFGIRLTLEDIAPVVEKQSPLFLTDPGREALTSSILLTGYQEAGQQPLASEAAAAAFRVAGFSEEAREGFRQILAHCEYHHLLPLIYWAPPASSSAEPAAQQTALDEIAESIREFQRPVILYLDLAMTAGSALPNGWARQFAQVLAPLRERGASNVAVAWQYAPGKAAEFPGRDFADLIILPLSEAEAPAVIAQFAQDSLGLPALLFSPHPPRPAWREALLGQLADAGTVTLGWISTFSTPDPSLALAGTPPLETSSCDVETTPAAAQHPLTVDGSPFRVKGVVYNPQQDWRDGRWPLIRRQLQHDFGLIKEMGANTISRIRPTVYDYNILNVAQESGLKVLYGLWCDPSLDYYHDQAKAEAMKNEILGWVKKYRNHPALLAWMINGSAWTELANHFHQPYLTKVRLAYSEWLDEIACEIKRLDPERPVIVALDGGEQLVGALDDLRQGAATVDIIAVNAYHEQHFQSLEEALHQAYPGVPYLISAFGPKERWWPEDYAAPRQRLSIPDPSPFEKAQAYPQMWRQYIAEGSGNCLGGLAYCWRDRHEGTSILSGMVDYKGRRKPAYFALKQTWTGEPQNFPLADLWLKSRLDFSSGQDVWIFTAIFLNDTNADLTYEWYISREEYLERIDELHINFDRLGLWGYKILRAYRNNYHHGMVPEQEGRSIHFPARQAEAHQRVYLHISDNQGNVVTASLPMFFQPIKPLTK